MSQAKRKHVDEIGEYECPSTPNWEACPIELDLMPAEVAFVETLPSAFVETLGKKRKHVYIVQVEDLVKFRDEIGDYECPSTPNWEACRLGMYIELDLMPAEVAFVKALPSAQVFDSKQHVLTDHERDVNRGFRWSKEGYLEGLAGK